MNEENRNIQVLLQESGVFVPKVNDQTLDSFTKTFGLQELEDKALVNRPDLLIDNKMLALAELNYSLQKKAVIPDARFNVSSDQRGGAFKNQVNAGVALPL